MQKFGRGVVKLRVPILIVSVLLLIPSIFGFVSTRINYDILSYLPSDIETMKGQDIMLDEFGKGGFSLVMLDGMEDKDVEKVKKKIEKVDHVCDVLWYDTLADVSLPKEVLPDDIYDFFNTDNSTMMAVFFDEATSALDNNTQAKITENLNRLKCTKIIVAHRLSLVRSCDRILVMDKGVIVQEGTFDELSNTDGLLQQLMKRQTAR